MNWKTIKPQLPGILAAAGAAIFTSFWAFWGAAELFHEGWWAPFPAPLAYLIPFVFCLVLALAAVKWPRLAGWVILTAGGLFSFQIFSERIKRGTLSLDVFLSWFPVTILIILVGGLFLLEGRYQKTIDQEERQPSPIWWRRHWRTLLIAGLPTLIVLGVSAAQLPRVLTRYDDGDRGAQLIEGNGVTLVWAPAGPGWSMQGEDGGLARGDWIPSWQRLALYGLPPVGFVTGRDTKVSPSGAEFATMEDFLVTNLCRFLDETGTTLLDSSTDLWRMPTVDELVRSLVRDGENAGCTWDGVSDRANCRVTPDKEIPLWATNWSPIYMWALDEYNTDEAYYVSYNGWINWQPKNYGNSRHGYRCVREP